MYLNDEINEVVNALPQLLVSEQTKISGRKFVGTITNVT